jgi:hypothetical protein
MHKNAEQTEDLLNELDRCKDTLPAGTTIVAPHLLI